MALQEVLAKFAIDVNTKALTGADAALGKFREGLSSLGSLIAGAAVLGGIKSMVTEMVNLSGELVDTSARLGVSTDALQRWQYFAVKAGGSAADVEPAFRNLQKNIADLGGEGAKAGDLLKTLGVKTTDAGGRLRPMGDIATEAGLAIAALEDPAQQSKAALELFGKQGTKLLPLFKQGKAGMAAVSAEFDKFGGGLSQDAIQALDQVGDATDGLDLAMTGLKAQIVVGIAPALVKLTTGLGSLVAAFKKSDGSAAHLKNVLIGIGVAGALAGARAAAPWLGIAAALALTGLLFDDLITAFNGGDSVIGDTLDSLFGEGAGDSIFKSIKKDASDLWAEMEKAPTAMDKLEAAFSGVGGGLAKFFAEELPAAIGVATENVKGTEATWSDLFQAIADKLAEAFHTAWTSVQKTIHDGAKSFVDTFAGLADAVGADGGAIRAKFEKAFPAPKNVHDLKADGGIASIPSSLGGANAALAGFVASGVQAQTVGVGDTTITNTLSPNNAVNITINASAADLATLTEEQVLAAVKRGNNAALASLESVK